MTRLFCSLLLLAAAMSGCDAASPTAPDAPQGSALDCGRFTAQTSSAYILPYPVWQAATVSRTFEHGPPQGYAVDFLRPIGSLVVAARAGLVVEVDERWSDADHEFGHENHVFIAHDDGTVARYFHLTQAGADVAVGERVAQGQGIGRSGDSGNSTSPHLHFDVVERPCQGPWPAGPYSDACHNTVPVSFRNTRPHTCGLTSGVAYTALPQ